MEEASASREPLLSLLLSDTGLLVHGGRRVRLSGTDDSLVRRLLDEHPRPLPTRDLARVLWPDHRPSEVAVRRRLARVRRELFAVGLALRHRPGVGYTLERSMFEGRPLVSRDVAGARAEPDRGV